MKSSLSPLLPASLSNEIKLPGASTQDETIDQAKVLRYSLFVTKGVPQLYTLMSLEMKTFYLLALPLGRNGA